MDVVDTSAPRATAPNTDAETAKVHIETKTVLSADGTRIFAQAAGSPRRVPLVCVHGICCSSYGFRKQFQNARLLEHVYLIAYDVRGSGRSGRPLDDAAYDGSRFAEDFKAVCEVFGVVRPVLMGWSLGGMLILDILTHLPPGTLRGAIYTGGGIPNRGLYASYYTPLLGGILPPLLSTDASTYAAALNAFLDAMFGSRDPAYVESVLSYDARVHWLGETLVGDPRTAAVWERASRARDPTTWEGRVKSLPVLVVQGRNDLMVDSEGMRVAFRSVLGPERSETRELNHKGVASCGDEGWWEWRWIEDAGHAPMWEKWAEHDELVVEFVRQLVG